MNDNELLNDPSFKPAYEQAQRYGEQWAHCRYVAKDFNVLTEVRQAWWDFADQFKESGQSSRLIYRAFDNGYNTVRAKEHNASHH